MPLSTFLWWFILLWLGGWACFPLAERLTAASTAPILTSCPASFSNGVEVDETDTDRNCQPMSVLADGGLALGRVLFLTAWTLAAFAAGYAGLPIQRGAWLAVPLLGAGVWYWATRSVRLLQTVRLRMRPMLTSDALFLVVFLLFFLLRGFWSDTAGNNGEKTMDAGLISALVRAPRLPPPNPYAAGSLLQSYYYFGHLETALVTNAVGSETRWTYNLMAATLPALCFPLLFALGATAIPQAWRHHREDNEVLSPVRTPIPRNEGLLPGLLVAFAVLMLGTLEPLRQLLTWIGSPGPHHLDFFSTSRVIPYAINEYPWFTFNEADLHAHYFGLCLQLATLTLAFCIFRGSRAARWTVSAVLGAQIMTNTWDFPVYALLVGLCVVLAPTAPDEAGEGRVRRIGWAVAIALGACLLAFPYLLHLKTAATPPRWLAQPASPSALWFLLWGPFAVAWTLSLYLLGEPVVRRRQGILLGAALVIWLAIWLVTRQDYGVLLGLLTLISVALIAAPRLKCPPAFWLVPGLCGLLALLWSETTWAGFLGDPAHPKIEDYLRQDTVFKFGLQAWVLWGAASVAMTIASWQFWPRALRWSVLPVTLVMLLSSIIVMQGRTRDFGTQDIRNRWNVRNGWDAWDGWAHLAPPERAAAKWLQSHTPASENLLEAFDVNGGDYTAFGRFASATGIPTIMGPQAHTFQWAPAHSGDVGREWAEVARRRQAVTMIYQGESAATRKSLLDQFHVRYIVCGNLELQCYGMDALLRLRHELPIAYEFGANSDPNRVTLLLNPN